MCVCVQGFQCSNWRRSPCVHHASNWNEHECTREGVSTSKSSAVGSWDLLGGTLVCVWDRAGETRMHEQLLGRLCPSPAVRGIHVVYL